jgi:hypothetical protein
LPPKTRLASKRVRTKALPELKKGCSSCARYARGVAGRGLNARYALPAACSNDTRRQRALKLRLEIGRGASGVQTHRVRSGVISGKARAEPIPSGYPRKRTPICAAMGTDRRRRGRPGRFTAPAEPCGSQDALAARCPAAACLCQQDQRNTHRASSRHAYETCRGVALYASDMAAFSAWGGQVPASPESVAFYLAASDTFAASTLLRRLAALADAHQAAGHPDPTKHPLVRKVFRGIRRVHGARTDAATPLDIDMLARIIAALPNDLTATRPAAGRLLLCVERSELVALAVEDLERRPDDWIITIQRSKTDPYGRGQHMPMPAFRGPLCPTAAVADWLAIAQITEGPVFRAVRPDHKITSTLPASQVGFILSNRAAEAGLGIQRRKCDTRGHRRSPDPGRHPPSNT